MTNETDLHHSEDQFPQSLKMTCTSNNDDTRRRVSISQTAIQADIEKEKRKNSNISNKSNAAGTNGDATGKGYTNPAFDHSSAGKPANREALL